MIIILAAANVGIAADAPATQPAASSSDTLALLHEAFESRSRFSPADILASASGPNARPANVAAAKWIERNRDAILGVQLGGPLAPTPWGYSTYSAATAATPGKLYLAVFTWHASGNVIAYGLDGQCVKRAYLLASPEKELKTRQLDRNLLIEVTAKNAKAPDPLVTVVVLELAGEPKVQSSAVAASPDGSVLLHAKDAIVTAQNLRYEPEPNKNTLGYWTNPKDGAYWEFTTDKAGTFDVELLQGCGKNSGGSTVEVTIDQNPPLTMVVQDTGHFQNFVPRVIGQVKLNAGEHRLQVAVKEKKGAAVMDLRQVTLKPR